MSDGRVVFIRAKNAAYHRLYQAARAADRRWHTTGNVPAAWMERLRELEMEYRAASWQCRPEEEK